MFFKNTLVKIVTLYLGSSFSILGSISVISYNTSHNENILLVSLAGSVFLLLSTFFLIKLLKKPLDANTQLLERFLKDTTHELNTPLSVILNNIEMIDKETLSQKDTKRVKRIEVGAKTIAMIYDDLSYYLFYQTSTYSSKKLNLSKLLHERIEYFSSMAELQKIKFILTIEEDTYLEINEQKMLRVFDNLLSNAIKYSKREATIKIHLKHNLFSIEDNGKGMSQKQLQQIFQRYKRFDTTVGGFGIGYSIIYAIVQEYNIDINIESTINKGTKVTLKW